MNVGTENLGGEAAWGRTAWVRRLADYWTLTKPEVNSLVVVSAAVGFYLASSSPVRAGLLFHALFGTLLVASGTATLNQYMERSADGRMRRTAERPLPAGRLRPAEALAFGLLLSAAGALELWLKANPLASLLALLTLASYLLIYTPLKRKTAWCTFIGAIPGAMPPLIGWAAARGRLDGAAWVLYAIQFFWQFPHFLSIAWMYREDYERAGLLMLPARDLEGRAMAVEVLVTSIALVPVSLLPAWLGQAGWVYAAGALAMGLGFFYFGASTALVRSKALARRLLMSSIVYLPLVLGLLAADSRR